MELFLALIGNLISFAKSKQENNEKLFSQFIDPLHSEFKEVTHKYYVFFSNIIRDLNKRPLDELIASLKVQRNEYILARIEVTNIAKVLKENEFDQDLLEYIIDIEAFFFNNNEGLFQDINLSIAASTNDVNSISKKDFSNYTGSDGEWALRRMEELEKAGELSSRTIHEKIMFVAVSHLENMRNNWQTISEKYAELRLAYLVPKKL
ncbi:MAG: hypothetical protein JRF62_15310 [Deltaproteobacteria bacterium]|nr:hypothetical protein [Deltaproteobacteria bacterium]